VHKFATYNTQHNQSSEVKKGDIHHKVDCTSLHSDNIELPDKIKTELRQSLGLSVNVVIHTVRLYYKVASCYPGSIRHHHSEKNGLWVHGFETALKCVQTIRKYSNDEKDTVIAFLAGLLHDIGKIAFYELDTGGFDFNPLSPLFQENDYNVKGKKKEGHGEHAHISAAVLMSFLDTKLLGYPPDYLARLSDAISSHHTKGTKTDNVILKALKEADQGDVSEYVNASMGDDEVEDKPVNEECGGCGDTSYEENEIEVDDKENEDEQDETVENVEEKQVTQEVKETVKAKKPATPKTVNKDNKRELTIWKECLKEKALNEWKENFAFYVFKENNTIAIVNPRVFRALNKYFYSNIGKEIDESIILEQLSKKGYLSYVSSKIKQFVRIDVPGREKRRGLNCLCLRVDRLFTEAEIEEFEGVMDGNIIGKRVVYEDA
jgi:hypothetical protein